MTLPVMPLTPMMHQKASAYQNEPRHIACDMTSLDVAYGKKCFPDIF